MFLKKLLATQLSQLLLRMWREREVNSGHAFQDRLLDVLADFVPFSSASLGYTHIPMGKQGFRPHVTFLKGLPDQVVDEYFSIKAKDELAERAIRQPGSVHLYDGDQPDFAFAQPFKRLHEKYDLHHVCQIKLIHDFSGLGAFLSLYRRQGESAFTEDEGLLVEAAMPHLVCVLDDYRRLSLMLHAGYPTRNGGAALVDKIGLIHMADEPFLDLLHKEWPGWLGPQLPDKLVPFSPKQLKLDNTKFTWTTLPGEPLHLLTAHPLGAADLLTVRQIEVARAYASGKQHKVIANELGLSPATVRNHLRMIYMTLNVSNKQELAKQLESINTPHLFPGYSIGE